MPSERESEIVQVAIAYLNEKFGEHRRARWHIDVEREPGETRVSATTGALFDPGAEPGADPPTKRKRKGA